MSDIEADIQAAGANKAPRITMEDIEGNIASEVYFTAWEGAQFAFWCRAAKDASDVELATYAKGEPDRDGPLGLLTICVLVLKNGFTVLGESACASPANFNSEIGKKVARDNAIAKVWPLMGYELKSKLAA